MRIALFTPYSPEIGGGSVQLRSHLAHLPDLSVEWSYLADAPVSGAHRHWLGPPISPAHFAWDLSARSGFLPGSTKMARKIAQELDADLYWIVAHYAGISVAAELLRMGKTVHLTVHDEPLAMLIVSRRYRALWPLMSLTFSRVLKGARSVDVTSAGMRDYFKRKYNVDSFALYKHVPELAEMRPSPSKVHLTIGHIGKLYHPGPFRQFILACRDLPCIPLDSASKAFAGQACPSSFPRTSRRNVPFLRILPPIVDSLSSSPNTASAPFVPVIANRTYKTRSGHYWTCK